MYPKFIIKKSNGFVMGFIQIIFTFVKFDIKINVFNKINFFILNWW